LTTLGGAIKSGVLIQWQQTKVLRTRADLSYALVHNLELPTHFAKRAENERWFSRQNRDEKKTRYEKLLQYGCCNFVGVSTPKHVFRVPSVFLVWALQKSPLPTIFGLPTHILPTLVGMLARQGQNATASGRFWSRKKALLQINIRYPQKC
jgi:hypothetical protein